MGSRIFPTGILANVWELFRQAKFRQNFFDMDSCQWSTFFDISKNGFDKQNYDWIFWTLFLSIVVFCCHCVRNDHDVVKHTQPMCTYFSQWYFFFQLVIIFYSGRWQTVLFMTSFILRKNWCHSKKQTTKLFTLNLPLKISAGSIPC